MEGTMPLDASLVAREVGRGLSIVCATCRHYWRAKDAGIDGCGQKCAGPISGDVFPEYDGDLPDLTRWCFACGADSDYAIQAGTKPSRVGVCKIHLSYLSDLIPKDGEVLPGQLYAGRNGSMLRIERLVSKPRGLMQVILDQERAWEEEDRYNAEKLGIDPDSGVEE